VDDERTISWAYIDDFTVDYAFTTLINGAAFSLLFQREKPPLQRDKEKFERMVREAGINLTGWRDLIGGAAPHRALSNPVLFKNNRIIVGTLAGVMEPMLNFGMLGAMMCGKIGAIAVTDKGRAYEDFTGLTSFFKRSMLIKRVHDRMPTVVRKAMWTTATRILAEAGPEARNRGMRFVPGYGNTL
jgi:flavin-dependent dehydrogenase